MTGTLTDIIADMMARPDADSVLLDNGAGTWCLEALYDALQRGGDDGGDYYELDGTIYDLGDGGYIRSRRYWPADLTDAYTRQRLLAEGYDLPDIYYHTAYTTPAISWRRVP